MNSLQRLQEKGILEETQKGYRVSNGFSVQIQEDYVENREKQDNETDPHYAIRELLKATTKRMVHLYGDDELQFIGEDLETLQQYFPGVNPELKKQ
jgi:hypothetical protein